jgi:hypothetical protein
LRNKRSVVETLERKETPMKCPYVSTTLLTLLLGLSLVSVAPARSNRDTPGFPRLVASGISLDAWELATTRTADGVTAPLGQDPGWRATVISLDSWGLATIQTADGATYQLVKGLWWQVGDTVACQPNDKQGLFVQWALNCRSVLFGD